MRPQALFWILLTSAASALLACGGGSKLSPKPLNPDALQLVQIRAFANLHSRVSRDAYHLLAYAPYRAEDVNTLDASLWDESPPPTGGVPLQEFTGLAPDAPIIINNLKRQRSYWVRLQAFNATGDRIDSQDGNCVTQFDTEDTDHEASLTFRCRLADRTFAGFASGSIAIAGDATDIATISLELREGVTLLDQLDLSTGQLAQSITLDNLKRDIVYELQLGAINSDGSIISDCAIEADCKVTFTVNPDGPTEPLIIPVRIASSP